MKIKTSKPETLWHAKTMLGEGTLWVPSLKSIYFVDIKKRKISWFDINKSAISGNDCILIDMNDILIILINFKLEFLCHKIYFLKRCFS